MANKVWTQKISLPPVWSESVKKRRLENKEEKILIYFLFFSIPSAGSQVRETALTAHFSPDFFKKESAFDSESSAGSRSMAPRRKVSKQTSLIVSSKEIRGVRKKCWNFHAGEMERERERREKERMEGFKKCDRQRHSMFIECDVWPYIDDSF